MFIGVVHLIWKNCPIYTVISYLKYEQGFLCRVWCYPSRSETSKEKQVKPLPCYEAAGEEAVSANPESVPDYAQGPAPTFGPGSVPSSGPRPVPASGQQPRWVFSSFCLPVFAILFPRGACTCPHHWTDKVLHIMSQKTVIQGLKKDRKSHLQLYLATVCLAWAGPARRARG